MLCNVMNVIAIMEIPVHVHFIFYILLHNASLYTSSIVNYKLIECVPCIIIIHNLQITIACTKLLR